MTEKPIENEVPQVQVTEVGLQVQIARETHENFRRLQMREKKWHTALNCTRSNNKFNRYCHKCKENTMIEIPSNVDFRDTVSFDNRVITQIVECSKCGYLKDLQRYDDMCNRCHHIVSSWEFLTTREKKIFMNSAKIAIQIMAEKFGGLCEHCGMPMLDFIVKDEIKGVESKYCPSCGNVPAENRYLFRYEKGELINMKVSEKVPNLAWGVVVQDLGEIVDK